jgi:formate dehydrogenase assembly factor FdhD
VVLLPHSSNNLQQKNNSFAFPTNCGVCQHQQLTSLQNKTELVTSIFVIFGVEELNGNNIQVTKKTLMAKTGPRIMGFT